MEKEKRKCLVCGKELGGSPYLAAEDKVLGGYVCFDCIKNSDMNRGLIDYTRKRLAEYKVRAEVAEDELERTYNMLRAMKKEIGGCLDEAPNHSKSQLIKLFREVLSVLDYVDSPETREELN